MCCPAVLSLAALFLLVSRWCPAVPSCAVLLGALLRHVWCRRVLLRAVVFSLALCGVMVRCIVWFAVVPRGVVLVLPCCLAPPPPCCCPCCLAVPCVLSCCDVSCCVCGAVLRCAGALACCCSFWSLLLPLPGAVVLCCVLCCFFWRSMVRWCCPAVWCGASWCPGALCCVLWCFASLRCCAGWVCCAFALLFVVVLLFFLYKKTSADSFYLCCFFPSKLSILLKMGNIRHYPSQTTHVCSRTMAVNYWYMAQLVAYGRQESK